jgi:hypothetical protein
MPALIEVKLTELAQLFNSMDPAPFHERDLDHDAEEFIVSWAQEHPRDDDLQLIIHLTNPSDETAKVQDSVRHYFTYRSDMLWREFRQLMKEGRSSLLIGLTFMAACEFAALVVLQGDTTWKAMIREGLTILGWVAMWRPLEIYLYRWWPLLGKRRLYQRLARMTVKIKFTS